MFAVRIWYDGCTSAALSTRAWVLWVVPPPLGNPALPPVAVPAVSPPLPLFVVAASPGTRCGGTARGAALPAVPCSTPPAVALPAVALLAVGLLDEQPARASANVMDTSPAAVVVRRYRRMPHLRVASALGRE